MNPYINDDLDISLLSDQDKKEILVWADECTQGYITHRAHYEMERCTTPIVFSPSLWNNLPKETVDPEWIYAYARHSILFNLAKAYALTKEQKYLNTFKSIFTSFINYSDRKGESWRSLEIGIRPENWLRSIALLKDSQLEEIMKKSLVEHKEILINTHKGFHRLSNWGVLQDHGLFIISLYFDDLECAQLALNRLTEEAIFQTEANGMHWEQSPMYQAEVLHALLDTILQAKKANITVSQDLIEASHSMAKAISQMVSSNSNIYLLGDSDEINVDDLLTLASYLFNDDELYRGLKEENIFDALPNKKYLKKEAISYSDISSGNHIIRTPNLEVHLFSGNLGSGHGHISPLHIDVSGKANSFFIDSGRYTYVDNEKRRYYKSAEAHNIPMLKQGYPVFPKGSWSYTSISETSRGCFVKRNNYELVQAENYSYNDLIIRRKIIKASDDIIVLLDEYISNKQNDAQILFHLHPNCKIKNNEIENGKEKLYLYSSAKISVEPCCISLHYNEECESKVIKLNQTLNPNESVITIISTKSLEIKEEEIRLVDSNRVLTRSEGIAYSFDHFTLISRPTEIVNQVDILKAGLIEGYGKVIIKKDSEKYPTTLYW